MFWVQGQYILSWKYLPVCTYPDDIWCQEWSKEQGLFGCRGTYCGFFSISTYSSTVKTTSFRLLEVISHSHNLKILCGDIGNAFINTKTHEKVYCREVIEFGKFQGNIIIIKKALYGLKTSAEWFHTHLEDTLHQNLWFKPSRDDPDVWLKPNGKSWYDYIWTHVDDFKIISKDPQEYMSFLKKDYLIKDPGPPKYYLGNDYVFQKNGQTTIGCTTYISEALNIFERIFFPINPLPIFSH